MAYLDDRIWCHPKLVGLSCRGFRAWVNAIAYSSGFGLRGRLTPPHQHTLRLGGPVVDELVAADLWERDGADVLIHDWDDYNGQRDDNRERVEKLREQARERKRRQRARESGANVTQMSRDLSRIVTRDVTRDPHARARSCAQTDGLKAKPPSFLPVASYADGPGRIEFTPAAAAGGAR